ncbi:MAG: AMP-binding protein [Myxococcales bacterium]|nr:AMP-binding protein [Myxococcales bacterium]
MDPALPIWRPDARRIADAHITRLMARAGAVVDPQDGAAVAAAARDFVARSQRDIEWFWELALEDMDMFWQRPYERLLDVSKGHAWAQWFIGGQTNIAAACVDRHTGGPRRHKTALIAETEDGRVRRFNYAELAAEVGALAAALRERGVGVGDRVACYMPMVAEVVFAMLATQKLGAIFIPIFSGYAAPAVRERLEEAGVKLLFTADASSRRGAPVALKEQADRALDGLSCVQHVLVVERGAFADCGPTPPTCPMRAGRDTFYRAAVEAAGPAPETVVMDALAPALMLFTSGTTGKPKGTVHTHAGCLAQMGKEILYNFDLHDDDVFWWFSDIGWMMGPWEIIGCFMHGGSIVIFEGAPDFPEPDRVFDSVERHGVTTLGISPTAVRMLMRAGDRWAEAHPMASLRTLGSTGEPWDPESYHWYFEQVGKGRCPIINISGGTDIVGCFLAPLPIMALKPASLQSAGLGMAVDVFDDSGRSVVDEVGYLVCKKPAPSMTRSLWNNDAKYLETYWSKFPEVWNHGDWARIDADGDWYLYGRADDTMKIAGRRVGPGEIEAALIEHEAVSEAAAVGVPDELKGTEVVCFVVLHPGHEESDDLRAALKSAVVEALGKVDRPREVLFVDDLPKTRSAKILRRLIQRRYLGAEELGDLSSVQNPEALEAIAHAR